MRGGHVSGESIVEVICESHKDEERDAFIRRYNNEPLPAPPPPKPVVPVIEPILADDARPAFNYESVASAAAATPTGPAGFTYALLDSGTSIDLQVSAAGAGAELRAGSVPEPTSVALIFLGMLSLVTNTSIRPSES